MNLQDLSKRLAENKWDDASDVDIFVDNGDGEVYTVTWCFDYGNHIVIIGDNRTST